MPPRHEMSVILAVSIQNVNVAFKKYFFSQSALTGKLRVTWSSICLRLFCILVTFQSGKESKLIWLSNLDKY